ncbi:unnamed protein product [Mytilus coruscus]|uniref:DUF4371 domain-containing protein n=1 Tax=Mytilus coruscus TaxID=42192 RepID=A0A6J8EH11_MYTCO|nr:unnamed protein product [Mytilus coruscus]
MTFTIIHVSTEEELLQAIQDTDENTTLIVIEEPCQTNQNENIKDTNEIIKDKYKQLISTQSNKINVNSDQNNNTNENNEIKFSAEKSCRFWEGVSDGLVNAFSSSDPKTSSSLILNSKLLMLNSDARCEKNVKKNATAEIPAESKDIANLISTSVPSAQMYSILNENWNPPSSFPFPKREMYGFQRCFKYALLHYFRWVVYSTSQDGIYCKFCVLFATDHNLGQFVKKPVQNWVKAKGECKSHEKTKYHQTALLRAQDFTHTHDKPASGIDARADTAIAKRVDKNRQILMSIGSTIVICGRQNIALRGHRENNFLDEGNKGNFLELVKFRMESGDEVLKEHLHTCGKNETYVSKTVQNNIIRLIGDQITDKFLKEIKDAQFYSVLTDEVTDVSNWAVISCFTVCRSVK